ncbi:MAG: TIGR03750 family conjugal transfer protein [Steroidobacteraceae bacterium]|nr:TIGR03750 family conjugal transfer protein [Steroidobacteraceae bacterium]
MAEGTDPRRDAVTFLPHRLNRQPVIVRGLTADELWITTGVSAACGLAVGLLFASLTRRWAIVPTAIVLCVAAGIFLGGGVLRRQKRGRPETWLYRQLQWWVRRRVPALSAYVGGSELITRSGYWTTRRTTKRDLR